MKYCNKCKITVKENTEKCPLCYATLEGNCQGCVQSFPRSSNLFVKYNLVFRILIFTSIVACITSVVVNWLFPTGYMWSLIVIGSVFYSWASSMSAIKKRYNIGLNITAQTFALSLFVIVIDLLTGFHGWAFNYAVPFVCISGNIAVTVIIIIMKFDLKNYIIYLLTTVLLGILPLFFLLFSCVTVNWWILLSAGYALFTLIGALVFADHPTRMELKKRLHL